MLDVLNAQQDRVEALLAGVRPEQLDDPTPSYVVRDLINHIVGGQFMFAMVAIGQDVDPRATPPDYAAGDFVAAFRQAADAVCDGFCAEGAMERIMHFPFEGMPDMPGAQALAAVLTELVVHGWDLAKGTGQDSAIDPQLAQTMLAGMLAMPEGIDGARKAGFFAPEVIAAPDASPVDRLMAYLGREP